MFATIVASNREARDTLRAITPDRLDAISGDEAITLLDQLALTRRVLDSLIATTVARIDATAAYRGRGDRNSAETCSKALRSTAHAGQVMVNASKALVHAPVRDALVAGTITTDAAALVHQTLQHAPDHLDPLLHAAEAGPVELTAACIKARAEHEDPERRRKRQHASRSLHTWNDADGMHCGRFRLAPEVGGAVKAVLDAGVQRHFRNHRTRGDHEPHSAYAADTLVELILEHAKKREPDHPSETDGRDRDTVDDNYATAAEFASSDFYAPSSSEPDTDSSARNSTASRTQINVHVLIDYAALIRGNARPGETCEIPGVGPVNVQWVRDILGDSFLTAIIRDGTDIRTIAHHGRHINKTLRTALLVEGRQCDIVGCHRRGYLEIDHIHDHSRGGPTSLDNLHFLCSHHHGLKTRGWTLTKPDPETHKRTLKPPRRARAPDQAA